MITRNNICEAVVLVTGRQEVPFGGHFIGKNHSNNSEIKMYFLQFRILSLFRLPAIEIFSQKKHYDGVKRRKRRV